MLRTDAHEPQQHLRHAEIPEAPRKAGRNGQRAVGTACAEGVDLRGRGRRRAHHGEEAVNALCVFNDRMQTACGNDRQDQNEHQHRDHHDALHEIRRALGQIPAEEGIDQHEHGCNDHHAAIGEAEQIREQLAACGQALRCVDAEENDNNERADRHNDLLLLMEAIREEIRQRKGVHGDGIPAQPLRDDQEVEVGTDGEPDARPSGIGKTGPVCKAGQAHQKIPGHVGRFRAERRDPWAKASPAEEVGLSVLVCAPGKINADPNDSGHIQNHGQQMLQISSTHTHFSVSFS